VAKSILALQIESATTGWPRTTFSITYRLVLEHPELPLNLACVTGSRAKSSQTISPLFANSGAPLAKSSLPQKALKERQLPHPHLSTNSGPPANARLIRFKKFPTEHVSNHNCHVFSSTD
jgi:hypothetical protein